MIVLNVTYKCKAGQRDAAAVEAHKGQVHFARLGELKSAYVEETVIEKYET